MRKLVLAAVLVLMASGAQASSYLDIFGTVHDPIQLFHGGNVSYSGPNLEPGVVAPNADLYGAYLTNANLSFANLSNAYLRDAHLDGADLSGANLSFATLGPPSGGSGATLSGATLSGANLYAAHLSNADLTNADLTNADLTNADLANADLTNAHLTNADLTNADLANAHLWGADLSFTTGLGATTGSANYYANTTFTGTGFDPVAAGWNLVPEPNTALLLGLGLVGMATRRRV